MLILLERKLEKMDYQVHNTYEVVDIIMSVMKPFNWLVMKSEWRLPEVLKTW